VSGTITLLTDFGARDAYVAAMKGVIARIAPGVRVIDITHEVAPQDVRGAGITWAAAARWFPEGSVHVAVVDPGVGTRRRILAFRGRGSIYLAPDNGLVGHVLERREVREARIVERSELFLPRVSRTFHGRDIFAPVAAHLASGLELAAVGRPVPRGRYERDELPRPRVKKTRSSGRASVEARGEVIYIDVFGNAMTNLMPMEGLELSSLEAGGLVIRGLSMAYGDVRTGRPLAIEGSSGWIEIAVNQGNASRDLGLEVGDRVVARWS
jgi:S-adenosylmethionine hydrolase